MSTAPRTEDVSFQSSGATVHGYLALPHEAGSYPAVVLVHDVRGLSEHYRDVARRFSGAGFIVLAVDFYSREGAPALHDMAAVFAWMRALPDARVLGDVGSAVRYLAARPDVRADAVGVTGFCMGGQYALMAACSVDGIAACVSWYGMLRSVEKTDVKPSSPLDLASQLRCPYIGFFGADDALIPAADVDELRSILERTHATHEIHVYHSAGHAFFNDTRADAYRPAAAADSWKRAIAFFRQHLGPGGAG